MITEEEKEFLFESNLIEGEPSKIALRRCYNLLGNMQKVLCLTLSLIFSVGEFLKIHSLLMQRLNKKIAGRIREFSIYIGGDVKRTRLKKKLKKNLTYSDDWNVDIKKTGKPEYMEKLVKEWHVWFEKIHPFADGNGRTGRNTYEFTKK